jgi:hypothetical protein
MVDLYDRDPGSEIESCRVSSGIEKFHDRILESPCGDHVLVVDEDGEFALQLLRPHHQRLCMTEATSQLIVGNPAWHRFWTDYEQPFHNLYIREGLPTTRPEP